MRRPNLVGRVVASQMGTGSLRRRIDISKPTEPPAGAAGGAAPI